MRRITSGSTTTDTLSENLFDGLREPMRTRCVNAFRQAAQAVKDEREQAKEHATDGACRQA